MVVNTHTKLYIIEPTVPGHSSSASEESGQVYPLVHQGLAVFTRLILHFQEPGKKL